MTPRPRSAARRWFLATVAAVIACSDGATTTLSTTGAQQDAVKFWEVLASTHWNERAITLLDQRPPANGQAAASRILTYLSLAQYRAVLAAESGVAGSTHPSIAAAVGRASAAVLSSTSLWMRRR
jgi:hypothetical protein